MEFPNFFGRLLVICPHFDDACFSIGGFLLKKPFESVTILTIFSKSQHAPNYRLFYPLMITNNHLHLDLLNKTLKEVISKVRKKEDSKFCRQIGAIQSVLPFEDSSLRGCPAYNPIFSRTEIDSDPISGPVFKAIEKWVFSGAFDSILCPMGIGNQVDHLIVLSAIEKLFEIKPSPQVNLFFYEDLPYSDWYELDLISSLACERIFSDSQLFIEITNEILLKQSLMDIYFSQGQEKAPILRHAKRLTSVNNNGIKNGFYERIWRFGFS